MDSLKSDLKHGFFSAVIVQVPNEFVAVIINSTCVGRFLVSHYIAGSVAVIIIYVTERSERKLFYVRW